MYLSASSASAVSIARLASLCLQPATARAGSQALMDATSDVRELLAAVPHAASSGARKLLIVRARSLLKEMDYRVKHAVWQDLMRALQCALDAGDLHESLVTLVVGMLASLDCHKTAAPAPLPLAHVLWRAARAEVVGADALEVCRQPRWQRPMLKGVAYVLAQDLSFLHWDDVEFADEARALNALALACANGYVFHPTPAFQNFLERNIAAVPSRAARRAFIERFAPHLAEHLLFLEPEEEDMLQEIVAASADHDAGADDDEMQTVAARLRELAASLGTLPALRALGNPLASMTAAEFRDAIVSETDGARRPDVLILLLARLRGRALDGARDNEEDAEVEQDLEDACARLIARSDSPPCVRLAVALFGACDVEALLLARQMPLDEVAIEYFSHRLPRALQSVVAETLLQQAPWQQSSTLLDTLLANFAQWAAFDAQPTTAAAAAAASPLDDVLALVGERALPPVDALSLLCLTAHALLEKQRLDARALLQNALLHLGDETEDPLAAARRFALICLCAAQSDPEAALYESAVLAQNETFAFIHAQILLRLLRAEATRAAVLELASASSASSSSSSSSLDSSSSESQPPLQPWTALLIALHEPDAAPAALGVLLTSAFDATVAELPPQARKRVVDGALHALLERGLLQMLDDRQTAIDLLARLFAVLGTVHARDLADDASSSSLPFDRALGVDVDLFPNCDLRLNTAALENAAPALLDDQWPPAQSTVLRTAVGCDGDLAAVTRAALASCCDVYTFPALQKPAVRLENERA